MLRNVVGLVFVLAWTAAWAAPQHAAVDKSAKQTSAEQLQQARGKDAKLLVIDVRTPQEFAAGHIPGAINIPLDDLARKLADMKVRQDTTLVTVCEHGGRSSRAAVELQKMGYKTTSYCTLDAWRKRGYKIETGDAKPHAGINPHPSIRPPDGPENAHATMRS